MPRFLYSFVFILFSFFIHAQTDQDKAYHLVCVGFYNIENLYDTIDDPLTNDEEFLPNGAKKWNTAKYKDKLNKLSKVISQMGTEKTPEGVSVIGLAEVENTQVLRDLINTDGLRQRNMGVVHFDGPDRRGVDVALLYRKDHFKVLSTRTVTLVNPENQNFRTRDQLLVTGELFGERMHFMVAHWPSRRGGEKRSAPLRMLAAQLGRAVVDSIMREEPNAKIIYMGDLNDDPVNKSLTEGLRAKGKSDKLAEGDLYNTSWKLYKDGIGTLAWNDAWNLFDQMIITPALLSDPDNGFVYHKKLVFNKPFVKQQEGNFKGYPFRSFVGDRYDGGYSDHFAVYMFLKKEIRNP
ncbi:MAG: endonuclease/exonuclease/phosphatase family protein [Flavobacteriales bacterium]